MGRLLRRRLEKEAKKNNQRKEKQRNTYFSRLLADVKGKRFTGEFVCDLCGHNRAVGYVYALDDREYEICKFCHDTLFPGHHSVRAVYTPMGNGR